MDILPSRQGPGVGSGPLSTIFQNVLTRIVYDFTISLIVR
jgi:hypothetical protein